MEWYILYKQYGIIDLAFRKTEKSLGGMPMELYDIILRLLLALVFGGVLGVEREIRRRPAGLRTYMLVCVGSALVMITNELMSLQYPSVDPARMGAQVISGIGFLGAGTIIVTGKNKVQGLTTAAGLWATACVGLTVGAGYLVSAAIGCAMSFVVVVIIYKVDDKLIASSKIVDMYLEFDEMKYLRQFIRTANENNLKLRNLDIIRSTTTEDHTVSLLVTIHIKKKETSFKVEEMISRMDCVSFVERI